MICDACDGSASDCESCGCWSVDSFECVYTCPFCAVTLIESCDIVFDCMVALFDDSHSRFAMQP